MTEDDIAVLRGCVKMVEDDGFEGSGAVAQALEHIADQAVAEPRFIMQLRDVLIENGLLRADCDTDIDDEMLFIVDQLTKMRRLAKDFADAFKAVGDNQPVEKPGSGAMYLAVAGVEAERRWRAVITALIESGGVVV